MGAYYPKFNWVRDYWDLISWQSVRHCQQMRIVKSLAVVIALWLLFVLSANAQCPAVMPTGTVCILQTTANRAAELVDKLSAAMTLIEAQKVQLAAGDKLLADKDAIIAAHIKLDDINASIETRYAAALASADAIIKMYSDMVDKMKKQMVAKKSGFNKLFDAIKVSYYIIATAFLLK